jgi:tripartite-type tricarboxylate transporter receptor subunit TctC
LNKALIAAVALADVQERSRRDGYLAQPMNPDEFTNFIAAENAKWKTVIEHAGLAANAH